MGELRFDKARRYALAFSGGCDSSCLLAFMLDEGIDVKAYLVKTAFQAEFELEDACRVADELGAEFEVVEVDILSRQDVCENTPERCYFCKRHLLSAIKRRMRDDGREVLVDGTNASDDPARRPGFRALGELGVLSPLREAGWTKDEVRARSRAKGLFTADKPNFSCLAVRVPANEPITEESLDRSAREAAMEIDAWRAKRGFGPKG